MSRLPAGFLCLVATSLGLATPALAQTADAPATAAAEPGWQNGSNYQPASLLTTGPVTWSMMVDTYYGYDFNRPADHTVFPTTTAPRSNEFNLDHALLGAEVTGIPRLDAKLVLQAGNYVDTLYGSDHSLVRGAYTGLTTIQTVQQAFVSYQPETFHGNSLLVGLFPAYIGMESYIAQENWDYTHSLLSDFTPYYLMGASLQGNPRPDVTAQLWLVNGWQTVSKVGEGVGLGWQVNYHPTDRLTLVSNMLSGNFDVDQTRTRFYTDSSVQWNYARQPLPGLERLSLAAVADLGYETPGTTLPGTALGGLALYHRAEFKNNVALGLRGSVYSDPQQLVALTLPNNGTLPAGSALLAGELTATLDYRPIPWLLYRLEYRHDASNIPYIAGPGGITGTTAGFKPDLVWGSDRVTVNATVRL